MGRRHAGPPPERRRVRSRLLFVFASALLTLAFGSGAAHAALPLPTPSPPNLTPPQIDQAPSQIFYGRAFTIVTRDASRVVKVSVLSVGGGAYSATLPILGRTANTLLVQGPASP